MPRRRALTGLVEHLPKWCPLCICMSGHNICWTACNPLPLIHVALAALMGFGPSVLSCDWIVAFFCLGAVVVWWQLVKPQLGLTLPGCLCPGRKRKSGNLQTAFFFTSEYTYSIQQQHRSDKTPSPLKFPVVLLFRNRSRLCNPGDVSSHLDSVALTVLSRPSNAALLVSLQLPQLLRALSPHGQR